MRLLSRFYLRGARLPLIVLSLALTAFGQTPLWSQGSEPSLNNHSVMPGNSESSIGQLMSLQTSQMTDLLSLREYQTRQGELLAASLRDNEELRSLRYNSLMIINDLENSLEVAQLFAEQAGERMQARDMDLYDEMQHSAGLEETIHDRDKQILRMWIVIVIMGAVILGCLAFAAIKIYLKAKKPF